VLRAVPEEADGAVAKVQKHANTIALLEAACLIFASLAMREQGSIQSMHEPAAIGALSNGIKVRPADADQDA
jgi:hypothetical protein